MKSTTLTPFWEAYHTLDKATRRKAKKAFQLWAENRFHPSLHFKCINTKENLWSVRISLSIRAIGVLDEDGVTWFWIGGHDEYERFFS